MSPQTYKDNRSVFELHYWSLSCANTILTVFMPYIFLARDVLNFIASNCTVIVPLTETCGRTHYRVIKFYSSIIIQLAGIKVNSDVIKFVLKVDKHYVPYYVFIPRFLMEPLTIF
jgi:hypothetical protein